MFGDISMEEWRRVNAIRQYFSTHGKTGINRLHSCEENAWEENVNVFEQMFLKIFLCLNS